MADGEFPQRRPKWRLSHLRTSTYLGGRPGLLAHSFEEALRGAGFYDRAHVRAHAAFAQNMQKPPQGAFRVDISYFRVP
jgi:hypothetical protein